MNINRGSGFCVCDSLVRLDSFLEHDTAKASESHAKHDENKTFPWVKTQSQVDGRS